MAEHRPRNCRHNFCLLKAQNEGTPTCEGSEIKKNCRMREKKPSQHYARTSAESHVKLFSHIPEIKVLEGFV